MLRGGNSLESTELDAIQDHGNSEDAEWVALDIEYSCSGRNDVISVVVDADTRILDFKRNLYANYSHILCEPERMQIWFRGQELIGDADETLSLCGIDTSVPRPRIFLKESPSDRFQDGAGRSLSLDMPMGQSYGGAHLGMGDGMRDPVTASLMSMVNDPKQLKYFVENSPQMQEMLKSNPEV